MHTNTIQNLKDEIDKMQSELAESEVANVNLKHKIAELQQKQPLKFSAHRLQSSEVKANEIEKQSLLSKIEQMEKQIATLKQQLQ